MATRLYINVSQAYMPLYIQHSLQLPAVSIAVIPLIMFISGFVVSIVNKPISKFVGRKWSMIGGCLVGVAGAVWVQFGSLTDESFTKYEIYAISVLIGAAGSQMLITRSGHLLNYILSTLPLSRIGVKKVSFQQTHN